MNQQGIKRFGTIAATGAFALVVLAACGAGGGETPSEPVTRVPEASEAAIEATKSAPETSPAAETAAEAEASPAVEAVAETGIASPAAVVEEIASGETPATPAATIAAALGDATPTTMGAASPVTSTVVATPIAAASPAAANEGGATPVTSAGGAATPAAAGEATGETVEVVSIDIAFEPKALTIPADTDVTFVLPNEGAAPHNFSIDELDISVDQAPGTTEEIVINAPAGTYEYYCNVPGHKEAGMIGTLTVE